MASGYSSQPFPVSVASSQPRRETQYVSPYHHQRSISRTSQESDSRRDAIWYGGGSLPPRNPLSSASPLGPMHGASQFPSLGSSKTKQSHERNVIPFPQTTTPTRERSISDSFSSTSGVGHGGLRRRISGGLKEASARVRKISGNGMHHFIDGVKSLSFHKKHHDDRGGGSSGDSKHVSFAFEEPTPSSPSSTLPSLPPYSKGDSASRLEDDPVEFQTRPHDNELEVEYDDDPGRKRRDTADYHNDQALSPKSFGKKPLYQPEPRHHRHQHQHHHHNHHRHTSASAKRGVFDHDIELPDLASASPPPPPILCATTPLPGRRRHRHHYPNPNSGNTYGYF